MPETRLNPYQGAPNREGFTPPAWGIDNFARWFRPSMFDTRDPGLGPSPSVLSPAAPSVSSATIRPGGASGLEGPGTMNRDENWQLNQPEQGGEATTSPTGGPTPASEGGRAFAEGSPFSGLSGRGINTGLNLANAILGLPAVGVPALGLGVPALGFPLAMARAAENLSNYAFNPATNNLQMAVQSLFGTAPTAQNANQGVNAALASQRAGERGDLRSPDTGIALAAPTVSYAGRTGAPGETGATGQSSTGVPFGGPGRSPDLTTPFAQQQNLPGFRPTEGPKVTPNDPVDAPPATPPENPDITNSPDVGIGGPSGPGGPSGAGPGAGTASGDSSTGGDPGGSTYGRGGPVQGPSQPVDSVPARLTGGEFVTNPYATQAFRPMLELLNRAVTAEGVNPRVLQLLGFLPQAR